MRHGTVLSLSLIPLKHRMGGLYRVFAVYDKDYTANCSGVEKKAAQEAPGRLNR